MKQLCLVISFAICSAYSMDAQVDAPSLKNQLMGYWYSESIDTSWGRHLVVVHKLHFTPDSLWVSNFGDQFISSNAANWSCHQGGWVVEGDSMTFRADRAIYFSCNTGFWSALEEALAQPTTCRVSLKGDFLTLTFVRNNPHNAWQSALWKPQNTHPLKTDTYVYTYQRKPLVEMYDGTPPATSIKSQKRWIQH